ncbi:MAG TPA: hypothetical protein VNZ49_14210 [Bacteroidia bacterium]|jgi:hypothetical protein|nr:hypothetical protein [Bacteroidia bacterium]
METNKSNKAEENKTTANSNTQNTAGGLDLNGIINDPKIMEILKHLLSGGGAMAGSYFIWIKPIQDKIDALNTKITEQDKRIKELEEEVESLTEDENSTAALKGSGNDYLNVRQKSLQGETRKYRQYRF